MGNTKERRNFFSKKDKKKEESKEEEKEEETFCLKNTNHTNYWNQSRGEKGKF